MRHCPVCDHIRYLAPAGWCKSCTSEFLTVVNAYRAGMTKVPPLPTAERFIELQEDDKRERDDTLDEFNQELST